MRIAARMSTIGTETAFEVSARGRALEAEGRSIIHLQIGEPDFDTPANVREAAKRRARRRRDPLPAVRRASRRCARRSPTDATARKGFAVDAGPRLRHGRRQGRDALRDPRPGRPGRRGHRPGSRLPDLRVDHPLRRRHAGPDPDPDGERLPARRRRAGLADHAADEAARDQLAGEPDRRRPDPERPRARSPSSRIRHDLSSSPTRSTAGSCTTAPSTSRSPRCPGWPSGRSSSTASPRRSR